MSDTAAYDTFTPAQATGQARLQRARTLDRRMRARTRRRQQDLAANAFDLWELSRQCLWAELGYSGLGAYAWDAHGYRASKTSDLLAIARACRHWWQDFRHRRRCIQPESTRYWGGDGWRLGFRQRWADVGAGIR